MQLLYLNDVFEDNYIIARNIFETYSLNVMKNRPLVAKKHKFQYILTWLSHIRKPWKLPLGTTTLKTFLSHTGL